MAETSIYPIYSGVWGVIFRCIVVACTIGSCDDELLEKLVDTLDDDILSELKLELL